MPVEATVAAIHEECNPLGLQLGAGRALTLATYIDNLYAVASTPADAIAIIELAEDHLIAILGPPY